ncbi:MAG: ABC transporter permease [Tepidisphaeraceae bacterium]
MTGRGVVNGLLRRRESGIFLALVGLVVLITICEPGFARWDNVYTVSRQIAYTAIVALGVFFVILTSGIDLSVGSIVGLSGVVCGWLMFRGCPASLAVCAGLATGMALGAINGAIVSYIGVTPFIVTLGTLGMARGVVYVATHGDSIRGIPESFISAGLRDVWIFPMAVVVLGIIAVIAHIVLTYTAFGRRVYAVGGNEAATTLSGINTRRVKLVTYMISGLCSAVAGVLFIARYRSAQAEPAKGIELDAIAAAVIGGTSLMGGEGTVAGVLIGATIMGVIRSGLVQLQVSSYWQELIIGAIIVLAAIMDVIRRRRAGR